MLTVLVTFLVGLLIGFAIGKVSAYLPISDSIFMVLFGPVIVAVVAIFIWYPGAVYGWFCMKREVRKGTTVLTR